ncbi:MAG: hypothetical protein ACP5N1_00055 [Candidatus Woesearchaeota archaeon]
MDITNKFKISTKIFKYVDDSIPKNAMPKYFRSKMESYGAIIIHQEWDYPDGPYIGPDYEKQTWAGFEQVGVVNYDYYATHSSLNRYVNIVLAAPDNVINDLEKNILSWMDEK